MLSDSFPWIGMVELLFFVFFFNVQPTKGMHDQIIIKTLIVETNLGQQCEPVLSPEFN